MQLTTSTAAMVLGISRKSLDNLLVAHAGRLRSSGRQGRSRRISYGLIERIAVALLLTRDLGAPLVRALALADLLIDGAGSHSPTALSSIRVDLSSLRSSLSHSISAALEETSRPRRGRPPGHHNDKRGAPG